MAFEYKKIGKLQDHLEAEIENDKSNSYKYTSKGNLIKHQRTAKYCLEIQEKKLGKDSDKIETRTFNCDFCTKKFSQKSHLFRHTPLCINKYKFENTHSSDLWESLSEIDELKLKSDEFRDEIKNIAYD